MRYKALIPLRHKRLVGGYQDDLYSPSRQRLEFYRWLYLWDRLSDFTPEQSALEPLPGWWSRLSRNRSQ